MKIFISQIIVEEHINIAVWHVNRQDIFIQLAKRLQYQSIFYDQNIRKSNSLDLETWAAN